jgi:nicotinate-nucleotide adenylyltransferase
LHQRLPIQRLGDLTRLPPSAPGMRIGLFGGSFNPPHEGHLLVAEEALRRLELDRVFVLVSPGNPLKNHRELAPLAERVTAARALIRHPGISVTGFEAEHGFAYSWQTLAYLRRTLADRKLVWIMGADNLVDFHHWERWRDIAQTMPICVYVRPGSERIATGSRAARALARFRLTEADAPTLPDRSPPAWVYLTGRSSAQSSSALRSKRRTQAL